MTPKNNETKIDDVKKKIIISMCAIILLILTLFGITYAYLAYRVEEEEIIALLFQVTAVTSGTIQTAEYTLVQLGFKSHDTLSLVVVSTSKRLGH